MPTPTSPHAVRPRVDGARVLMTLPSRGPAALPARTGCAAPVLRSTRVPTQLSLFPTPGQLMATKR